jgi:DNA polymerase I
MPILHVFGRDQSYQRHHVAIEGERPYFCVRQSEWIERGEQVAEDDRILDVVSEDVRGRPETAIDGEPLLRVICREPSDVGDLRELFDDPFEADVLFPVRFLVDYGVYQWIEVPDDFGDTIHVDDVTLNLSSSMVPEETPPPRVCTYDIEVRQGGGGAPVVSEEGTEQARNPITAITAHDSYTDDYTLWILAHDDWDADDSKAAREAVDASVADSSDESAHRNSSSAMNCEVSVYKNARNVAGLFAEYVVERDFDVLTGWAASGFDHPYYVNYCLNNNVNSIYELSPTGDVYPMNGDGNWINSSLKGRLLVDLLDMYQKTKVHSLDSYRLEDVAIHEDVSVGKLAIEDELDVPEGEPGIDYAWQHHPEVFVEYSLRDVQAAVGINRESQENVNIV